MYIENPTNIQHKVIPIMRKNVMYWQKHRPEQENLCLSSSIMEEIEEQDMETNTLIIVPTRELANQITDVARSNLKNTEISVL